MRTHGAGAVSIMSMARGTLGGAGAAAAGVLFLFLHYALLVAYIGKAGELLAGVIPPDSIAQVSPGAGVGLPGACSVVFSAALALLCFAASQRTLDVVNGTLVAGVVATFLVCCAPKCIRRRAGIHHHSRMQIGSVCVIYLRYC